jgi:hypothetical protein
MRAAVRLAERGMYVFPLRPLSKQPAVRRWERAATRDPDTIRRVWRSAPYNIGVAAGPSRLVVVDLDGSHGVTREQRPQHGRDAFAALARAVKQPLPGDTLMVATPGGWHLYFRAPDGVDLRNTAGRLGPRIDTRARGGYVVAPGSHVGRGRYRIVHAADPAPLPEWILERLRPRPPRPVPPRGCGRVRVASAYIRAAVRGEADRVAGAPVGQRNHALFRASARLGEFVAAGHLPEGEARAVLAEACSRHLGGEGFRSMEMTNTIDSGIRTGRRSATSATPSPVGAKNDQRFG